MSGADAKLRAVVVGTGFGCRIQVPALRAAGFEVVALVGSHPDQTRERARDNGVPGSFTDLVAAIRETGATVVAVATPPHTHGPLVLSAIANGCHVICEKPFAADAEEARQMLQAAANAGVAAVVGHEFRWSPERAMLKRVIEQGRIGEPRMANFTSLSPYLLHPGIEMPDWWFDEAQGGGWLGAAGSHLIDWMRDLLGEIDAVSATLFSLSGKGDGADDSYAFRFRTESGADGVVQQSAAAWGDALDVTRIIGSRGAVWLEGTALHLADAEGTRAVSIDEDLALPPIPPVSTDPRQASAKWKMLTAVELPAYLRLCEGLRSVIVGDASAEDLRLPTFGDGLACMEVLDAVRLSAAEQGRLVQVGGISGERSQMTGF